MDLSAGLRDRVVDDAGGGGRTRGGMVGWFWPSSILGGLSLQATGMHSLQHQRFSNAMVLHVPPTSKTHHYIFFNQRVTANVMKRILWARLDQHRIPSVVLLEARRCSLTHDMPCR